MKGKALKMTMIAGMVFAGMMALAQVAEAAGQAAAAPTPLPEMGKGTGIGFRSGFLGNAISAQNTQLSLKINMDDNMAISPYLGFGVAHIADTDTEVALGLRVYPTIAKAKQVTFFGFGGLGAIIGSSGDVYFGFDLSGGFGAEYFFAEIPNLGLSFEAGADFSFCHITAGNGDTVFGFHSVGQIFGAGVHYYFGK